MVVIMTIKNYAIINSKTHIIENVIIWDGRKEPLQITKPETIIDEHGNEIETGNTIVVETILPWTAPINTYVVCIENTEAGIGWLYNDGKFVDVRIPPEETITTE